MLELKRWRASSRFDALDQALLSYTEKLALAPWAMTAADLQGLRAAGYSESQVLNIVLLNGYRNYITRIADGTGIVMDDVLMTDAAIVEAYSYNQGETGPLLAGVDRRVSAAASWNDESERQLEAIETDGGAAEHGGAEEAHGGHGRRPWIATVPPNPGCEATREIAVGWIASLGFVPNFIPAMGLNPAALTAVAAMAEAVLFTGEESARRRRELVAATVARVNRCRYLEVAFGSVPPPTGEEESVLAAFAERLSVDQLRVTGDDLEAIREFGLDDPDILDLIVEIAALNGITRIVSGLGVPPDRSWIR